jgi:hypothetical protein
VYQFDVTTPDIAASMVHIAEWDSFYSPSPPFATLFSVSLLAPDGKIYMSTGNSTDRLHAINQPDQPGLACDLVQHGIVLPTYYAESIPNHPNYHLGPVDGSVCDSLGINAGVPERGPPLRVSAYPNPNRGTFTLNYDPQAVPGMLEVRDVSGRLLLQEGIPPWSSVHVVTLSDMTTGLYDVRIRWRRNTGSVRIVIQP